MTRVSQEEPLLRSVFQELDAVFFRFGSALLLIVLVCLAGVGLEKRNLALRRALSKQQYQIDILLDSYARLRLKTQQMADPARLLDSLESKKSPHAAENAQ